jgi:hypothetical protein
MALAYLVPPIRNSRISHPDEVIVIGHVLSGHAHSAELAIEWSVIFLVIAGTLLIVLAGRLRRAYHHERIERARLRAMVVADDADPPLPAPPMRARTDCVSALYHREWHLHQQANRPASLTTHRKPTL